MSIFDLFDKIESSDKSTVKGKPEFIIAGLGNPGLQYKGSRHNTGFLTIDKFCEKNNMKCDKIKFNADCGDIMIDGKHCLVMKPATFMNNSGEAIEKARDYYKIPCENVLVIYDDISMNPGRLRIRQKGSAGGHNGIKSIIACMGTEVFPRIKIGVGGKPNPEYDLADWVLGKFSDSDLKLIENTAEKACEAIPLIVSGKISEAMTKYSG